MKATVCALILFTLLGRVLSQSSTTSFSVTSSSSVPSLSASHSLPAASASASPSATPSLDTQLDPAFGVLGGLLIVTGLPSAFLGHKNRWSSFFLTGFYTLALACLALILKFGVLSAINPPDQVLRGVFVLACGVAGFAGGGIAIFFWKQTKYFIGAWGGFAIGLWIQCFHDGGVIRPVGLRWILYIACGVLGFVLCTVPRFHYQVLLLSTAIVGATVFILGIDCFTTGNLKEFYVYNIGFDAIFTTYTNNGIQFPVSQLMQVELGLIGAVAVMGAAVQYRILGVLKYKLREIAIEQKRRDQELEAQAAARFADTIKDLHAWEKEHGRQDSQFSDSPLMNDKDPETPGGTESQHTLVVGDKNTKRRSALVDLLAVPAETEDENGRPRDRRQSIGALPAMDLGLDIDQVIPRGFIESDSDKADSKPSGSATGAGGPPPLVRTAEELDDLRRQEELLADIQTIRRSIEILRSETPSNSAPPSERGNASRHQSFTSRRTLSQDFATVIEGGFSHTRPPRSQAPRARVRSMDGMTSLSLAGDEQQTKSPTTGTRPASAVLLDENWDSYVSDRKLFQPPSGVTAPIPVKPVSPRLSQYLNMPNAVQDALAKRRLQEDLLLGGRSGTMVASPVPADNNVSPSPRNERFVNPFTRSSSSREPVNRNSEPPVTILPPARSRTQNDNIAAPAPQRPTTTRVKTFEELTERHRERLHDLQAPLTRAEKEEAERQAAFNRWERSRQYEKQAMAKKEAEKRRSKFDSGDVRQEKTSARNLQDAQRSSRSFNDQLSRLNTSNNGSSKRQSLMKVEDWQRFQQSAETTQPQQAKPGSASRRDSNVPFPSSQIAREPGRKQ